MKNNRKLDFDHPKVGAPLAPLRLQGGSEGQKMSKVILKDLVNMKRMLKSTSKNIIPSPSYDFLKIAICL